MIRLIIQWLPMFEVLFFNLFSLDFCAHRKYSALKTVLVYLGFTAVFFGAWVFISRLLSLDSGNGRFVIFGFLYLLPIRFLYKERTYLLFIILCTSWVYTLGVLMLTSQIANLVNPGNFIFVMAVENLLFLTSLYGFYSLALPKYVYILQNIKEFQRHWIKYLILNNCLCFLLLYSMHITFIYAEGSLGQILAVLFLLATIYVSYYILYRVLLDTQKMNRLEREILEDPLTRLGNRSRLWQDLKAALDQEKVFSVLFMDLDRFKEINDKYGHMTGDRYLQHFAKNCSRIFGASGTVYRFGGDEFVAVYEGIIPESVIRELKECPGWDEGAPCPFNQVSTGVLHCQPPHSGVDQILQQVDDLMYQNKLKKRAPIPAE